MKVLKKDGIYDVMLYFIIIMICRQDMMEMLDHRH